MLQYLRLIGGLEKKKAVCMERISHSAVRCWETILVWSLHLQTKKVIIIDEEEKREGGHII